MNSTIIWIGIFCLALALRTLHLRAIYNTPAFTHYLGDSYDFEQSAIKIINGSIHQEGLDIILASPYLAFLSWIFKCLGTSTIPARLLQCLLGSLACLFIGKTALLLSGKKSGYLAALIAVTAGPLIYYDSEIAKPCLVNFCLSVTFYLLVRFSKKPGLPAVLLSSFFYTTALLLRMHLAFSYPLLLIWIFFTVFSQNKIRAIYYPLLFGTITFLTVLGWNQWMETSIPKHLPALSEIGINFYLGNNPSSVGTYTPLEGIPESKIGHITGSKQIAEKETGKIMSATEINDFWLKKTLAYITNNPFAWIKLTFKKLFLIFNNYEIPIGESYTYARYFSRVLQAPLLTFGVIAPFGLVGIFLCLNRLKIIPKEMSLIILFFLSYILSLMLTYTSSAYRLPIFIPMILLAVYAIDSLICFFVKKQLLKLTAACLAILLLLGFTHLETFAPKPDLETHIEQNNPRLVSR